jgi:hypothetical protein
MLDNAKIQELKAVHKELVLIETKSGIDLVFRKPKRLEYDQWFDAREKGSQAALSLAQQCLVHPSPQEFMEALEDTPGILMCKDGVVDAITDLAGADGGASKKKL